MTGHTFRVAVLAISALAGTFFAEKPLAQFRINDARVLYLMAQYKMAVGDAEASMELLRRATADEAKRPAASPQKRADACPLPRRG